MPQIEQRAATARPPERLAEELTPDLEKLLEVAKIEAEKAFVLCYGGTAAAGTVAIFSKTARKLVSHMHPNRCFASEWAKGTALALFIGEADLRKAVCSSPEILNRLPYMTASRKDRIVGWLGCTATPDHSDDA